MKRIAGIDEAGRGPIIGPLVIAGVVFPAGDLDWLEDLAARAHPKTPRAKLSLDSKDISPRRRRELFDLIETRCFQKAIKVVSAATIDVTRGDGVSLTDLEAHQMGRIVEELTADTYYIDAASSNADGYRDQVQRLSGKADAHLIAEHKADTNYLVVGAASVLAKETREQVLDDLKAKHGDFGSGYPTDPKTKAFLVRHYRAHRSFPPWVRHSWASIANLKAKFAQRTLDQFGQ